MLLFCKAPVQIHSRRNSKLQNFISKIQIALRLPFHKSDVIPFKDKKVLRQRKYFLSKQYFMKTEKVNLLPFNYKMFGARFTCSAKEFNNWQYFDVSLNEMYEWHKSIFCELAMQNIIVFCVYLGRYLLHTMTDVVPFLL